MSKIAIIGLAGLYPGSSTLREFWKSLIENKDCRSTADAYQMGTDPKPFVGKPGEADSFYCVEGGYIKNFKLSTKGLNITDEEVAKLDDVYKWSLYVAQQALRDAAYLNRTRPENMGLILGNLSFPTKSSNQLFIPIYNKAINTALIKKLNDESFVLPRFSDAKTVSSESGYLSGYPSAFIADALAIKGVNFCLDAACASSLYSMRLACDYLESGRADMMLAGAVSAADPFFVNLGFSVFQAYPENNISAPLDTRSQGLFAGEGAGMVVLKRYEDAVRDGDNIRAVILGGGLSNDGKGQHVLSPNTKGQVKAFERAYEKANINPATVDYVECHATGTPLGDKVELTSIENFFKPYLDESGEAAPLIGSVKSNLGHLLTAAGMPGVSKVVLGMENETIPASINIEEFNSSPEGVIAKEQICSENKPWPGTKERNEKSKQEDEKKLRAGVSVFGFGGANAHMVFEEAPKFSLSNERPKERRDKVRVKKRVVTKKMSITGMDAHFGSVSNLAEFEKTIIDGDQAFTDLPEKRWRGMENEDLVLDAFARKIPKGAYIKDFDLDFLNFRLPPNQEDRLIPQQLLLMKVVDNALKQAKIEKGKNVAVLVAMGTELELHQIRTRVNFNSQFETLWQQRKDVKNPKFKEEVEALAKDSIHQRARLNQYTSAIGNIMAARISSLWDFSGPALTVSAEENSVFQALELAQIMLDGNEVEAAVVAGVELSGSMESLLMHQQDGKINNEAQYFALEENNQGWNVGEGAGAIVLEPFDEKGNEKTIYATIDGLAFSSKVSGDSLKNATEKVLKDNKLEFGDLGYLEMCASGFEADDQAEINCLTELAQVGSRVKQQSRLHGKGIECFNQDLAIGSVKSNIGHTFAAAGIASIIKSALCLHTRTIAPVPNWSSVRADTLEESTCYVPTESKAWFRNSDSPLRRVGVNSLGKDKRSCFLLMTESPAQELTSSNYLFESQCQLFSINGKDEASLKSKLQQLEESLEAAKAFSDFASQQYQLSGKREKLNITLLANDKNNLEKEIKLAKTGISKAIKEGKDWFSPAGSYFSPSPLGKKGKIAFVYPGAFNSYLNIAKDLNSLFPECHNLMARHTSEAATLIADKLYYPRSLNKISDEESKMLQKALPEEAISSFENGISVSVLYTDILKDILKVKPATAFGYSMGEVSMMYALGVWGKTDAMSKKLRSTPVFQTRLAGPMDTLRKAWQLDENTIDGSFWSGFALLAPEEKVRTAIEGEEFVRLILVNTDNEVVIAGKPEDCKRVAQSIGCDYFEAALGDVIHCDWVRSEYDALSSLHVLDVNKVKDVDFFTAVGNKKLSISSDGVANNIAEMYCNPVNFPKLVNEVYKAGNTIFIELGARDGLNRYISDILSSKEHLSVSVNRKGASDKISLLKALAKLSSHGVEMNLARLYRPQIEKENKKELFINIETGGEPILNRIAATNLPDPYDLKEKASPAKSPISPQIGKPQQQKGSQKKAHVENMPDVNPLLDDKKSLGHVEPAKKLAVSPSEQVVKAQLSELSNIEEGDVRNKLLADFQMNIQNMNQAHSAFLESRQQSMQQVGELIALQTKVLGGEPGSINLRNAPKPQSIKNPTIQSLKITDDTRKPKGFEQSLVKYPNADLENVIWNEADLVEFAEGDIAKVFGDEYKIIDSYHRRVRLPTTEYLLVTRVTKLNAEVGKYEPCSMTTEYDVPYDYWYSVQGQIPWAVAVESGQCDLLLISYLGIDFQNKGDRVYRLLDCELTFMDDVAMEGDTLRYDISINSYAQSSDSFLFFFSYDCYVGDKLVLTMRNGAAGFFTDEELDAGKGVIETDAEREARLKIVKQSFNPLLTCPKREYTYEDMLALCDGDLNKCFGDSHSNSENNPYLVYSAPKMLMIERITELDSKGGAYGLGLLVGEKTLAPEHWYFPCHFKQDQVMAGSLMSDGCSQLLRFYSWFLGLHTLTENAVFQPIPGLAQKVRCRGQVTPQHGTLIYRMEITEIGTDPYPFAKANVDIILNGKIVVDFKNLGLFLGELAGTELEKKIQRRGRVLAGDYSNVIKVVESKNSSETTSKVKHDHVSTPGRYPVREHPFEPFLQSSGELFDRDKNAVPDTLPFTQYHFIEFATGRIANCFGENFGGIYDGRTPPRTPNADLQLTTRVIDIEGERNNLKRISSCVAEFDCPADAWFFTNNTHGDLMPYSIIMEIALQPNGFISAWVGTTLLFPEKDLYFRNLDGSGKLLRDVDLRDKTITNESTLLSTTSAGNTIIQSFKYTLAVDGEVFYEGTSVFGYFLKEALTHQLGLDNGEIVSPWHERNAVPLKHLERVDLTKEEDRAKNFVVDNNKPHYQIAGPQLNLLDRITIAEKEGEFGNGYIYAEKTINPNDWFFPCHFHQDPVMPGSLGIEAVLQAMQLYALKYDLGKKFDNPRFKHELSEVKWKYRGQIIPENEVMNIDVHISRIEITKAKVSVFANANLYKDGLRIYQVFDAQISLVES